MLDIIESPKIDIMAIEKRMLEEPQVDCPLQHIFSGGIYIRQGFIAAGTLMIGKRHRYETCNMLLLGRLVVSMNGTEETQEYTAPAIFTSGRLVKKFLYFPEDSVFCNIHPTELTDVEEIEREFIVDEEEYTKMGVDICG